MDRLVVNMETGTVSTVALSDDEVNTVQAKKLTPEYLAEEKVKEAQASKLAGVEILGVMCSATGEDQNGLAAVALGTMLARAASQTFPDTVFRFYNGNTITVTESNFDIIYSTWMEFRQEFFAPE